VSADLDSRVLAIMRAHGDWGAATDEALRRTFAYAFTRLGVALHDLAVGVRDALPGWLRRIVR
jgi:hypothetical protein